MKKYCLTEEEYNNYQSLLKKEQPISNELVNDKVITSLKDFTEFLDDDLGEGKSILDYVYRGEEDYIGDEGKLVPYIFRQDKQFIDEKNLINGVINDKPHEFKNVENTLDILLKMQHYGIPTRLLDISFNPYKALYFALENPFDKQKKADRYVYLINKKSFHEKTINSDTVSIVASISRLTETGKIDIGEIYKLYLLFLIGSYPTIVKHQFDNYGLDYRTDYQDSLKVLNDSHLDIPFMQSIHGYINALINDDYQSLETFTNNNYSILTFACDSIKVEEAHNLIDDINSFYNRIFLIDIGKKFSGQEYSAASFFKDNIHQKIKQQFNQLDIIDRLLHEVRNYRPGFKNNLTLNDLAKDYLILPRETNQRIINQQGGFVLTGLKFNHEYDIIGDKNFKRVRIPYKYKKSILNDLKKKHSIEESYIYPELDHYNFRQHLNHQMFYSFYEIEIVGDEIKIFEKDKIVNQKKHKQVLEEIRISLEKEYSVSIRKYDDECWQAIELCSVMKKYD